MDESQLAAKKVALEQLGYDVTRHGHGRRRRSRSYPDSPAATAGLEGRRRHHRDRRAAGAARRRGRDDRAGASRSAPTFVVHRDDASDRDVTVPVTSAAAPSGDSRASRTSGSWPATDGPEARLPGRRSRSTPATVSGPSGGLAFTLTIIDELTPGNLTGGKKVAVTGTIDGDGTVGEVGGVPQKAVAAARAPAPS